MRTFTPHFKYKKSESEESLAVGCTQFCVRHFPPGPSRVPQPPSLSSRLASLHTLLLSPAPDHNHPCQCRASAAAPSGRPRDGALGTLGRPCTRCVCEIGIFLAQPRAQSILFEFNYLWVVPERCPCLWPRRLTVTHPSCINHPSIHAPARPPSKPNERTGADPAHSPPTIPASPSLSFSDNKIRLLGFTTLPYLSFSAAFGWLSKP